MSYLSVCLQPHVHITETLSSHTTVLTALGTQSLAQDLKTLQGLS